jgi:hypothetical protein
MTAGEDGFGVLMILKSWRARVGRVRQSSLHDEVVRALGQQSNRPLLGKRSLRPLSCRVPPTRAAL